MPLSPLECFQQLKVAVEARFRSRHPSSQRPITEWKGQEIVDFQEDLIEVVNGRISEKWFYTHIRSLENEKLPRIDMLNMLSHYAGFENWQAFVFSLGEQDAPAVQAGDKPKEKPVRVVTSRRRDKGMRYALIGVAGLLLASGLFFILGMKGKKVHTFCFVDADLKEPITDRKIDIEVLRDGESPLKLQADAQGCFAYETDAEEVHFVVQAAYYKPDTIRRRLAPEDGREDIALHADDYALMIHIFSTSKIEDWKKRRAQLDGMIAEDAEIFQLSPGDLRGMEMYNKEEFIDKMTMPLKSLRNVEILETIYDPEGRIRGMRFVQKEEK